MTTDFSLNLESRLTFDIDFYCPRSRRKPGVGDIGGTAKMHDRQRTFSSVLVQVVPICASGDDAVVMDCLTLRVLCRPGDGRVEAGGPFTPARRCGAGTCPDVIEQFNVSFTIAVLNQMVAVSTFPTDRDPGDLSLGID